MGSVTFAVLPGSIVSNGGAVPPATMVEVSLDAFENGP